MIQNHATLCAHGNETARETLVDIATHALRQVHPETTVPAVVTVDDTTLTINDTSYDLTAIGDLYVIGAGKGAPAVVQALQHHLGDRITDGVVAAKHAPDTPLRRVDVIQAGHPLPDAASARAGDRVRELAQTAGADDLVITCINGGASALLTAPAGDITITDCATLTKTLVEAGLQIQDINTVRKHVSHLKGGQLATLLAPTQTVTLVTVDEVAGDPWGPTVADETTFMDAITILNRHDLWDDIPSSVQDYLTCVATTTDTPLETPTPDVIADLQTQTVVLADAADVCEAAAAHAAVHDFNTIILSTMLEGESREVGMAMAGIAKEIRAYHRPVTPPCIVITGGETTVTLTDAAGDGGPNQEFAVQFALEIADLSGVAALAIGTDGTDGPTDMAGGLVDTTTAARATTLELDLFDHLRRHDTTPALSKVDDAVHTGPTGTNVMDLRLLLVE